MPEINSKDAMASIDIVSYESITEEDAKNAARVLDSTSLTLPDEKRLFLNKFYSSD
ncbi:uncharacterized protein NEMAJ01_1610 [Nematocida major]|uniref:uncharacterized protein n=1 Tax=Nematocida major TaxID=1912982 RepID=UPI0020086F44|nr:uncharacterized protein NEMAJ01_1610 [Nematocida major]KAH9386714.1 hypothetical protein NEMAJ01_1610 [Nematocida major]